MTILLLIMFEFNAISFVNKYLPDGTKSNYNVYFLLLITAVYKQYTALIVFLGNSNDYKDHVFNLLKDLIKSFVDCAISFSIIFSILVILNLRCVITRNFFIKIDVIKEVNESFYLQANFVFIFFVLSIFCTLIIGWIVYKTLNYFFKSEWKSRKKYNLSHNYPNKKFVLKDNFYKYKRIYIVKRHTENLKK